MILLLRHSVYLPVHYSALLRTILTISYLFIILINKVDATTISAEKIITVNVNGSGIITVGRDTISSADLAVYIRQRLFKSYSSTDKMYDAIKLSITGDPQPAVIEKIKNEIASGLKKTLNEVCLEKYKKQYDGLNERQQAKLKKNFPVLFQSSFE